MAAQKKKKGTRFYPVVFKLSARQRKSLRNFCAENDTTPIKVIKQAIHEEIELYANPEADHSNKRQLTLFADENVQQTIEFKD